MNRLAIVRILSVLAGAATLYGLQQGLDVKIYFAFPVALVVYFGLKVALGLLLGADDKTT
ncbi:MAG TPA: hypothetical protein VGF53_00935 [Pseudolabrys sp.]|jgi:hypothetical protein